MLFSYPHKLVKSIISARYYRVILQEKWLSTIPFLIVSIILLSTARFILFLQFELPEITTNLQTTKEEIIWHYPDNLTLTWKNGSLDISNRVSLPYPSFFNSELSLPKNLALLSPTTIEEYSAEEFEHLFVIDSQTLTPTTRGVTGESIQLTQLLPDKVYKITPESSELVISEITQDLLTTLINFQWLIPLSIFIYLTLKIVVFALIQGGLLYLILLFQDTPVSFGGILRVSLTVLIVAQLSQLLILALYYPTTLTIINTAYWVYMIVIMIVNRFVFFPQLLKRKQQK